MVKYNPKDWWSLIFKFHKSDTFRQLLPVMISIAAFCTLLAFLFIEDYVPQYAGTTVLHSLLGFVISLLLVFRTNTAYDRWWEGRKLWGALVNNTRNIALKIDVFLAKEDQETREYIADLVTNFSLTLKEHLRGNKVPLVAPRDIHQPNYIAGKLMQEINRLYLEKKITGDQLFLLKDELGALTDITGACERIKKTPIPFSYSMFIKKFIFIYIITMPFAVVDIFGYWSSIIVAFVFYVLASLEIIAEEIEDPFGTDSNDLPLEEITRTISSSCREILGLEHKADPEEKIA